jgi:hypothetical protein
MDAVSKTHEYVVLRTPAHEDPAALFDAVLSVLSAHPGDCDIAIETVLEDRTLVRIKPNAALRVRRGPELDQALSDLGCVVKIERANSARV